MSAPPTSGVPPHGAASRAQRLGQWAAGAVDAGVVHGIRALARRGPPQAHTAPGGMLRDLAAVARDYPADAPGFWRAPRPIAPSTQAVRALPQGELIELLWPSEDPPFRAGTRLRKHRRNRTAVARLHAHSAPRPTVVLIHGYGAGQWRTEARLWPLGPLFAAGLDVCQIVLPYHGPRADPRRRGGPPFPSGNPRRTVEGFRQAVHDLLDLVAWLKARGAPRVGVMGMSLGAYTAALAATVSADLDALGLVIPLGSFADYARDHGRLAPGQLGVAQHAAVARAHALVAPLARAPLIDPSAVWVLGAQADRVTPPHHAARLATHFGGRLDHWPGGHLLPLGRAEGWARAERFLRETLNAPPAPPGPRPR